jgi:hypothetical protein
LSHLGESSSLRNNSLIEGEAGEDKFQIRGMMNEAAELRVGIATKRAKPRLRILSVYILQRDGGLHGIKLRWFFFCESVHTSAPRPLWKSGRSQRVQSRRHQSRIRQIGLPIPGVFIVCSARKMPLWTNATAKIATTTCCLITVHGRTASRSSHAGRVV